MSFDVVIPTTGRPSLARLLQALARQGSGPLPDRVLVVLDAGAEGKNATALETPPELAGRVSLLRAPAPGPAAARNAGWRASQASWVAFLDDDVVPARSWCAALAADLGGLEADTAASQGRVRVPLPAGRRPTDWERNVAGLERAVWATADMAVRRDVLQRIRGFDERFRRAYREDSDLGLRITALGMRIVRGSREVEHPPAGSPPFWVSVRLQGGNADDALMRRLHGRDWRERAGAPPGRLKSHAVTVLGAFATLLALLLGRRRAAALAATLPALGTAELALARIATGPRDAAEISRMALTSAVLPFAAVGQRVRGELRWRRRLRPSSLQAVLFDRDGTLIQDIPYNGDPALVAPMPGARAALDALRGAGVAVAVISNQSGVARGLISESQVEAVNRRAEALLGPFAAWLYCPHGPGDGCSCRKPAPGLVLRAARELGVAPERCAVVGDIGADVNAAVAAGARGVLVPTVHTRHEEIAAARETAPDLLSAVERLLEVRP